MATPVQDSLVPYISAYDIVIPRGPEPVPALKAHDDPATGQTTRYIRQHNYNYRSPGIGPGSVYGPSGKAAALPANAVGQIIDTHV